MGITRKVRKVLISLSLGNKESYSGWLDFLRNLVKRGLRTPLSVTADGSPGLLRAINEVFPKTLRVGCWCTRWRTFSPRPPPSGLSFWQRSFRSGMPITMRARRN